MPFAELVGLVHRRVWQVATSAMMQHERAAPAQWKRAPPWRRPRHFDSVEPPWRRPHHFHSAAEPAARPCAKVAGGSDGCGGAAKKTIIVVAPISKALACPPKSNQGRASGFSSAIPGRHALSLKQDSNEEYAENALVRGGRGDDEDPGAESNDEHTAEVVSSEVAVGRKGFMHQQPRSAPGLVVERVGAGPLPAKTSQNFNIVSVPSTAGPLTRQTPTNRPSSADSGPAQLPSSKSTMETPKIPVQPALPPHRKFLVKWVEEWRLTSLRERGHQNEWYSFVVEGGGTTENLEPSQHSQAALLEFMRLQHTNRQSSAVRPGKCDDYELPEPGDGGLLRI